jgi:tetratricopeptide (TPR) repeat protein
MLTEVGQSELAYVPLMEEVRRKLLTEALQFNKEFLAQKGDDPEIRHQAALSHQHLADIHKMLGDYALADQENQEAIRQLQALAAVESPRQADYRADLALSHFHRGQLLRDQSRYADALAAYESARAIREELAAKYPEQPQYRRALGRTCTDVGQVQRYANRPADAARSFEQALAIHRKLVEEHPDEPDFRDGLGGTLNDLGALLRAGRKPAEARQAYEQALEQFAEMARRWPSKPEFRQKQAATRNNLGNVFLDLQDAPEAINILKQALAERQKLADQFPSVLVYRQDLASTHNNLAAALSFPSVGQLAEAEKEYAEAIRIQRRLVEDLPRFPDFRSQLGGTLDNLASLVSRQGDTAKARQLLDEALTHHQAARQSNPDQPLYRLFLRNHYSTLANVQLRAKAHAEAAAAVAEMLRLKSDGPDDCFRAAVLLSRCAALAQKDSPSLAQKYGGEAVGLLREAIKLGLADTEPIKTAAEFNPLRSRDDFKQLLGELK